MIFRQLGGCQLTKYRRKRLASYPEAVAHSVLSGALFAPDSCRRFENHLRCLSDRKAAFRLLVLESGFDWPPRCGAPTGYTEVLGALKTPKTMSQIREYFLSHQISISDSQIRRCLAAAIASLEVQVLRDGKSRLYSKVFRSPSATRDPRNL